jgi:hypothetical protein
MGCLMIVPLMAAIAAMVLQLGSFVGFLLASFTTVITSLAGVIGLVMLW